MIVYLLTCPSYTNRIALCWSVHVSGGLVNTHLLLLSGGSWLGLHLCALLYRGVMSAEIKVIDTDTYLRGGGCLDHLYTYAGRVHY